MAYLLILDRNTGKAPMRFGLVGLEAGHDRA